MPEASLKLLNTLHGIVYEPSFCLDKSEKNRNLDKYVALDIAPFTDIDLITIYNQLCGTIGIIISLESVNPARRCSETI